MDRISADRECVGILQHRPPQLPQEPCLFFRHKFPPNESVWVSDRKEGMGSAVFDFLASPAYLRIIPRDPVLSPVGRHTPEIQKRQEKKKIFRQKNLRARRKNGISVNYF
jgi:hypothetical protein